MKRRYIQSNKNERSRFAHRTVKTGGLLLILAIACASSRKTSFNTDGWDDSFWTNADWSAVDGSDSDANEGHHESDYQGGSDNRETDAAADWMDNLQEWFNHRLNSETSPQAPEIGIQGAQSAAMPVGRWIGQTGHDQYGGCLQSIRVEIQITHLESGEATHGIVIFGASDPPPPATDPDIGYPPGFENSINIEEYPFCAMKNPTPGFIYTIRDGRVTEHGRLVFRVAILEAYEAWCSLQTSYLFQIIYRSYNHGPVYVQGTAKYRCIPEQTQDDIDACDELVYSKYDNADSSPMPSAEVSCPIDLGKYLLCYSYDVDGPCICDEQACSAALNRTIQFDLTFDKTTMQGVIASLSDRPMSTPLEVRLRRVD